MQVVGFRLPEDLRVALRITSAKIGTPMSKLVADALLHDRKIGESIRYEMEHAA